MSIANYLLAKREVILNKWFTQVSNDPTTITVLGLTREEFNDQVPTILDILNNRLQLQPDHPDPIAVAAEHGVHRWHKGYSLTELLQELAHLHALIAHELELYSSVYANVELSHLTDAYGHVNTLMHEVIQGSAAKYNELQRFDAAQRATNLQLAIESLDELTRQRGDLLRSTSHDLLSHFSLIRGSAWLLDQPGTQQEQRQWRDMWQRNLDNAATLLTKLMDLARLEAGQETLQLETFDAGKLLRQIAESVMPSAEQRNLAFEWSGPESLLVEGDPVKLQRIAQNLLMNALNHTKSGWLTMSWSRENNFRWILSIQDSGPGLSPDVVEQLGQPLTPTADSTAVFPHKPLKETLPQPEEAIPASPLQTKGEGIGLLIVKRLCELLRANLDIETKPGVGTLIRVRFPVHSNRHI